MVLVFAGVSGHGVGLDMSHQCCGFMHNKSVQNVQNDLACVGCYQGEGENITKGLCFIFFLTQ